MIRKAEITDEIYVPYNKQSHISLVNDGLKGIPVTDASLATYTDENGVMWCADYVDCERRVDVQKVGSFEDISIKDWSTMVVNNRTLFYKKVEDMVKFSELLCNKYRFSNNQYDTKDNIISTAHGTGQYVWVYDSSCNGDINLFLKSITETPLEVYYRL